MKLPQTTRQKSPPSAERLHLAIAAMADADEAPTASALCVKAKLSRNALYRYHPEALAELRELQKRRRGPASANEGEIKKLQTDNDALKLKLGQLAALVDHYFGAWREASASLDRCEKQLSELRRSSVSKLGAVRK